ncbi:MAG: hypothetical protein ACJ8ER_05500 [Allosphingosinicella sp.]
MRKFLIPVLMLSSVAAVAPAAAQYRGGYGDPSNVQWERNGPSRQAVNQLLAELNRADRQIDRAAQRRTVSQREAIGLRREANQIRIRLTRAGRNGISGREFASFQNQVNRLEQRVRIERRDRDGHRY